jgi:hypothetical protein
MKKSTVAAALALALAGAGCSSGSATHPDGGGDGVAGAGGGSGAGGGGGGQGGAGGGHPDAGGGGGGASGAGGTGGGTGGARDGGTGDGTTTGTLQPLVDAFCATARSCCGQAGRPVQALGGCESLAANDLTVGPSLANGKVLIDSAAFAACVAAYQAAATSCTLTGVLAACRNLFVGTLQDGDACTSVTECRRDQGPMVCLRIQPAGMPTPDMGVCRRAPRATNGQPCLSSCQTGSDCSVNAVNPSATDPIATCYETDGLYCPLDQETCAPLVASGADCFWPDACGSAAVCGTVCMAPVAKGGACTFNRDCAAGLACTNNMCADQPVANDQICVGHPPVQ